MNPNIYNKYNVNVPETFKRIDNFLGDKTKTYWIINYF